MGIGGSARREKTTACEQPVSAHGKTGSGISRGLGPVQPITLTFSLAVPALESLGSTACAVHGKNNAKFVHLFLPIQTAHELPEAEFVRSSY